MSVTSIAALESPNTGFSTSKLRKFLIAMQETEYPNTFEATPGFVHQVFARIDSTQNHARRFVNLLPNDTWALFSAEGQTDGQGMHNRTWFSPARVNMYATYLFSLPKKEDQAFRIFQVAAVAVARTLQEFGLQPQIKWPNDVLLNRKKACGILCELKTPEEDSLRYVCVAGIGLNVNMNKALCESLDQPATSMAAESGRQFLVQEVTSRVTRQMQECVGQFCQHDSAPLAFHSEFDRLLAFKRETVSIESEGGSASAVFGTCLGVTQQGHLRLEVNGSERTFVDGRLQPVPADQ